MVLLLGIIFLALGVSLAVVWGAAIIMVLKGTLPLLLIFLGAIFLLVGYSERKAKREYQEAVAEESTPPTAF